MLAITFQIDITGATLPFLIVIVLLMIGAAGGPAFIAWFTINSVRYR